MTIKERKKGIRGITNEQERRKYMDVASVCIFESKVHNKCKLFFLLSSTKMKRATLF